MRPRFLLPCLLLAPLAASQQVDPNPTVNFTTPAVRAAVAVQELGKAVDRKLRVEDALADEPLILRIHNVNYETTLLWIADALHGTWQDQNGWKTLRRTITTNMILKNTVLREQGKRYFDIVQRRMVAHQRKTLDKETAERTILALRDPSSVDYANARVNSAEVRLIDRVLQTVNSNDIAGGGIGGRWTLSTHPRSLQRAIRLMDEELASLVREQNLWTSTLQSLAATHPELAAEAKARRLINPQNARIVVVMSRPVESVPTHVEAYVMDRLGQVCVYASDDLLDAAASSILPATDWKNSVNVSLKLEPTSQEYLAGSPISDALRSKLKDPMAIDPLRHAISDGLLSVAEQKSWNLVACPPDSAILPPTISNIGADAASLLAALEPTCEIKVTPGLMTLRARDPFRSELARTDRKALQSYLESVDRVGFSSFNAETDFLGVSGPQTNLSLAIDWVRRLRPEASPFTGSREGLAMYGLLSVDQRKSLLSGYPLKAEDLTPRQKVVLNDMALSRSAIPVLDGKPVIANGLAANMTEYVDNAQAASQTLVLKSSTEPMLRIVGVDVSGESVDRTVRLQDAARYNKIGAPWKSVAYSGGTADLRRFVVRISDQTEVVHLMPEFPQGMSPLGPLENLPADYRKALSGPPASPKKTSGSKAAR